MGRPIPPAQAHFAELYVAGEEGIRGNATAAYLAAYPSCPSRASAAVCGCRLLKLKGVRAYMAALREAAADSASARLRNWMELAPDAQETLRQAAGGELALQFADAHPRLQPELIRSAVKAATEILDRALGTTKQMHEHRLQGGIVIAVAGPPQIAPELESSPTTSTLTNGDAERRALPAPVDIPGKEADG